MPSDIVDALSFPKFQTVTTSAFLVIKQCKHFINFDTRESLKHLKKFDQILSVPLLFKSSQT